MVGTSYVDFDVVVFDGKYVVDSAVVAAWNIVLFLYRAPCVVRDVVSSGIGCDCDCLDLPKLWCLCGRADESIH